MFTWKNFALLLCLGAVLELAMLTVNGHTDARKPSVIQVPEVTGPEGFSTDYQKFNVHNRRELNNKEGY